MDIYLFCQNGYRIWIYIQKFATSSYHIHIIPVRYSFSLFRDRYQYSGGLCFEFDININILVACVSNSRSISIFWLPLFRVRYRYQYFGGLSFEFNININIQVSSISNSISISKLFPDDFYFNIEINIWFEPILVRYRNDIDILDDIY